MKNSPWKKVLVLTLLPLFGASFLASAQPNYVISPQDNVDKTIEVEVVGEKLTNASLNIGNGNTKSQETPLATVDDSDKVSSNGIPENVLIVIDGIESNRSDFELLKPKDIESMNVLKGDQATEKYGDKAKNGVIEVLKKK